VLQFGRRALFFRDIAKLKIFYANARPYDMPDMNGIPVSRRWYVEMTEVTR